MIFVRVPDGVHYEKLHSTPSLIHIEGGFFVLQAEYLQHSRGLNGCSDGESQLEYKQQAGMSKAGRLRVSSLVISGKIITHINVPCSSGLI